MAEKRKFDGECECDVAKVQRLEDKSPQQMKFEIKVMENIIKTQKNDISDCHKRINALRAAIQLNDFSLIHALLPTTVELLNKFTLISDNFEDCAKAQALIAEIFDHVEKNQYEYA